MCQTSESCMSKKEKKVIMKIRRLKYLFTVYVVTESEQCTKLLIRIMYKEQSLSHALNTTNYTWSRVKILMYEALNFERKGDQALKILKSWILQCFTNKLVKETK